MKISGMVYELEPFKDFILASEVKVDLGGQRSSFDIYIDEKLENHTCTL